MSSPSGHADIACEPHTVLAQKPFSIAGAEIISSIAFTWFRDASQANVGHAL